MIEDQVVLNGRLIELSIKLRHPSVIDLNLTREMATNDRNNFIPTECFLRGEFMHKPYLLKDGWELSQAGVERVWNIVLKFVEKVLIERKTQNWRQDLLKTE